MRNFRSSRWTFERAMRQLFHLAARPTPSGYDKPAVWHIVRADKELWTLVARSCRSGCKPESSGTRPLDALIKTTVNDPLVVLHLMPSGHAGPSRAPHGAALTQGQGRQRRQGRPQPHHPTQPPQRQRQGQGKEGRVGPHSPAVWPPRHAP